MKALYHIGGRCHPDMEVEHLEVQGVPIPPDIHYHGTQCVSIMRFMAPDVPLFNPVILRSRWDESALQHEIENGLSCVIEHAMENGFEPIINISIAPYNRRSATNDFLLRVIESMGGVVVNGIGNDGRIVRIEDDNGWPVRDHRVVAVGDMTYAQSNHLPTTHRLFQAHAVNVPAFQPTYGPDGDGQGPLTEAPIPVTGTSFASPQVAAYIALHPEKANVAIEELWQEGGDLRISLCPVLSQREDVIYSMRQAPNFCFQEWWRLFGQYEMADYIRAQPHWREM